MSELLNIINTRRTIRSFQQTPIQRETILSLIEAARMAPSGGNMQPLSYIAVTKKETVDAIFPLTRWAAYITPRGTPKEGRRPVSWIVVLSDPRIVKDANTDAGAAIQNILLAAWAQGIGSCWIGACERAKLKELLGIEEPYQIHSIIALGYPAQESKAVDAMDGNIRYMMDDEGNMSVPKRPIKDILTIIE